MLTRLVKLLPIFKEELAPIGFVAHVDTADFNADNIQPQIFENYDGQDIVLGHGYTLSATEFPSLKKVIGQTLITASGNTLQGPMIKRELRACLEWQNI